MKLTENLIYSFTTPRIPIPVALHRRGHRWYLVFPRHYGMAEGYKLWASLNDPQPADSLQCSPLGNNLNPTFWLRETHDYTNIKLEDLLAIDPPIIKDRGIKRTVKLPGSTVTIEESLVEVLLKEEQLCERCSYCGGWETVYAGNVKFQRESETNGIAIYWCGVSLVF